MASYGQVYYNVFNEHTNQYETSPGISDIFQNIVPPNQKLIKIGIQAPPGSCCEINSQKIMIGRSGLFELEGIDITSLLFLAEKKYIYSSDQTAKLTLLAKNQLIIAKHFYNTYLSNASTALSDEEFHKRWDIYYNGSNDIYVNIIKKDAEGVITELTFVEKENNKDSTLDSYAGYLKAKNNFNNSLYGVYVPTDEDVELKNIIIDYLISDYTEGEGVVTNE